MDAPFRSSSSSSPTPPFPPRSSILGFRDRRQGQRAGPPPQGPAGDSRGTGRRKRWEAFAVTQQRLGENDLEIEEARGEAGVEGGVGLCGGTDLAPHGDSCEPLRCDRTGRGLDAPLRHACMHVLSSLFPSVIKTLSTPAPRRCRLADPLLARRCAPPPTLPPSDLRRRRNALQQINEEAIDKVLEEQKYSETRRPIYEKGTEIIKSIPDFWLTAFLSHPASGELSMMPIKQEWSIHLPKEVKPEYSRCQDILC